MDQFNRLAFGRKVTPVNFQQVMDTIFSDRDFAVAYLVDILLKG